MFWFILWVLMMVGATGWVLLHFKKQNLKEKNLKTITKSTGNR
jgi:hypothetical protein